MFSVLKSLKNLHGLIFIALQATVSLFVHSLQHFIVYGKGFRNFYESVSMF